MGAAQARHAVESTAYSAIWTVPEADALISTVENQFESWLRTKGPWDPSTAASGYFIGPRGQELLVVHREAADGNSIRLRLTETHDDSRWRTQLTAHQSANESWLGLRVENNRGIPAKVPRLATYLLDALRLHDGATWLTASPRRAYAPDVEQIAAEVTDVERQGLYFVAGTNDQLPFDTFVDKVSVWTLDTRGMAQVVVLDPSATREFAAIVGPSHAVSPWTMRTFDTDVDPAVPADGRRHRILGTERLRSGRDGMVRSILGRATRIHAGQRPQPARFSPVHRALARLEDRLLVEGLHDRPIPEQRGPADSGSTAPSPREPAPQPAAPDLSGSQLDRTADHYRAQLELVKEVLKIPSIDRDALTEVRRLADRAAAHTDAIERINRQLDERLDTIEELELDRAILRETSEEQELELADMQVHQAKLTDEVRWLRHRLAALGDTDSFNTLPEDEESPYPSDFTELVDMVGTLGAHGVVFSGDSTVVSELADHDPVGRLAGVAWDCLLTLCDYVRARTCGDHTLGVQQYLESTPQGYRSVPPKKFAARETGRTMQEWGKERRYPVPTSVDPSGEAVMQAHFKLGRVGMVSPRMYYLDNVAKDGRVYVGYIGSHPKNTHTN